MIIVKTPIKFNHVRYEANSIIEDISDEEAKKLVDAGAAVFPHSKSEEKRVKAVSEGQDEVETDPFEGVTPSAKWSKARLLGFARAKGFEVEDTLTRSEIMAVINGEDETSEEATDEEAEEADETPEK